MSSDLDIFSKTSVQIVCNGTTLYVPEAFVEDMDVYKLQKEIGDTITFDVSPNIFTKLLCIDMALRLGEKNMSIGIPINVQEEAYKLNVKSIINHINCFIIEKDRPLYLFSWNLDEMKKLALNIHPKGDKKKIYSLESFLKKIIMASNTQEKYRLMGYFLKTYFSTRILRIKKYYDVRLMNEKVQFVWEDGDIRNPDYLIMEYIRNKIYIDVINAMDDNNETIDPEKVVVPKYVLNNFHPYLLVIFDLNSTNAVDQNGDKCIIFKYKDYLWVKYPSSLPKHISSYKDILNYNYDKDISKPKFIFLH